MTSLITKPFFTTCFKQLSSTFRKVHPVYIFFLIVFLIIILALPKHIMLCLYICLTTVEPTRASLSCQDENGNDVDWYISYKFPRLKGFGPLLEQGLAHAYIGPNDDSWILSEKSIGDDTSFVGHTLSSIYNKDRNSDELFYLLYNDQRPDGKSTSYKGHTKGVVVFDNNSGYWLIHSVPKFPPITTDPFSYPETGKAFGQSFLCITFPFSQADHIGKLLLYNHPFIYDQHLPDYMKLQLSAMTDVVKKKHVTTIPWNLSQFLTSSQHQAFLFFAKYKDFDEDLYSSWLAPYLQTDIYTETWQRGSKSNKLSSYCSGVFSVENIEVLHFPIQDITFRSTLDHSKIVISKNASKPWICIGDVNRTKPQKKRSGGIACLKSESVWRSFHDLVEKVEGCNVENIQMGNGVPEQHLEL